MAQKLKKIAFFPVRPIPVHRDKVSRLYVQQAKFEAGLVLFPKGAAFLPELERELLTFPQSRTDDQVDSISQALAHDVGYFDYRNMRGLNHRRTSIMEYFEGVLTDKKSHLSLSVANWPGRTVRARWRCLMS